MFIATYFINLECALFHLMGPDLYDIYLAMTCTMMLLIMVFKCVKNLCLYFKTKNKLKCVYKYLSRMRLALLISECWQDDTMIICNNKTQKRVQHASLNMKNYCTRIYIRPYKVSKEI
jgi:hypothetical protein